MDAPTTTNGHVSSMGLKGVWAAMANLSAVALVCVMFYQSQGEQMRLAREDRQMFRDEMRATREERTLDRQALVQIVRSVESLTEEVQALKQGKE